MKWSSGKNYRSRNFGEKYYKKRKKPNKTSHVLKLLVCSLFTGMFLSGDSDRLNSINLAAVSPQKITETVDRIASDISVKIFARNFLGSGFLLGQTTSETTTKYFVVTNQHVLRAGDAPYEVETPDGKLYSATVSNLASDDYANDLAVLTFETDTSYPTAKIGSSLFLEVGEPVFAAGFPQDTTQERSPDSSPELTLKSGRIAVLLNRALVEGYQIGYTNDVKRGMSGGPLLNSRGEVIGINGKHAYPLWESPEIYQDGSQPCSALQELITRSSLAIPIEKSIELTPLKPPKFIFSENNERLTPSAEKSRIVEIMQEEAEQIQQKCQN